MHTFDANLPIDWNPMSTSSSCRLVGIPFCPDLLRYDQLGEADNLRGKVVRAFFYLMRLWPV